jgi:hypothetical protein
MGNSVRIGVTLDDKVSGPLAKIRDNFDRLGKSKGAAAVLQGVGVGLGISAYNLLGKAVSTATDFIGDSIAKAAQEQVGIERLSASLRANVTGWDGNTKAIEDTVYAMEQASGFSDGDLRDSLARLVGETHDVSKAFELQRTAMDLARFTGSDLVTASTALIRVEGGQYRALKGLIGSTKDITTEQEALAAVQEVAGGQWEAYGDSAAGAQEKLRNAMSDLEEEIGTALLPTIKDLTNFLRTDFIPAAKDITGVLGTLDEATGLLSSSWDILGGLWSAATTPWAKLTGNFQSATSAVGGFRDDWDRTVAAVKTETPAATKVVRGLGDAAKYVAAQFDKATGALKGFYDELSLPSKIVTAKNALLDDAHAVKALEKAHRDGKITIPQYRAQMAELTTKIYDDKQALLDLYVEQAKLGKSDNLKSWFAAQLRSWAKLTAAEKAATAALGDYFSKETSGGTTGRRKEPKASGGPVLPGQSYTVGEHGPETLVMGSSGGFVIPNGGSSGGGGGSGSPVVIQVNLDGATIARVVDRQLYRSNQRAAPTLGRT